MAEKISIKLLENEGLTKILFNKNAKLVVFTIYGDCGFYYTGKISSNSNNISILFETTKDKVLFIKITEIKNKHKKSYNRFFDFSKKKIKKNISMKISNIESKEENNLDYDSILEELEGTTLEQKNNLLESESENNDSDNEN